MSARTIEDQGATARDVAVAEAADRVGEMADKPGRATRIYSRDSMRAYILEPTADGVCESAATSLVPVVRGDTANLMRVLRQLEIIVNRQTARIAFKAKGNILLLNLADVAAVHAAGNYVSLQHRTRSYLVHESLSSLAEKLRLYGFIRIHRSVVVNTAAVEEIQPLPSGDHRLRVEGGKEYLVTRTYKHNLRDLAQLWVGPEHLSA